MNRTRRCSAVAVALIVAAVVPSVSVDAAVKTAVLKSVVVKAVVTKSAAPKPSKATKKTTKKVKKPTVTTTTKKSSRRPANVSALTTTSTTIPPTITTSQPIASVLPPDTTPPTTLAPGATIVIPAVTSPAATTTTIKAAPTTTSTLPPAPFPAPANAPSRLTATSNAPYRGLGTWVDRFDWTTQWSKKPVPPFNVSTVDQAFSQGVQTIFIQGGHWAAPNDVLEPEKLIPIIDRAHQLGMQVVVWYLPSFQDVNTDLRKVVALANLDVDGISIDIEERDVVKDINERNRRLVQFTSALRGLLPGRFLSNNIIEPTSLDGVPGIWTQPDGKPPQAYLPWWKGPFPYVDIAPAFDLWMIQAYWTNRTPNSGWRDGYRYVAENVNRLRANVGRPDLPIHVIGGVGDKAKAVNDVAGMLQAARDVGAVGVSFYDWLVTDPTLWQYFRIARTPGADGLPDPRFPATVPPAYVPSQPPPVTTVPPVVVVVPGTTTIAPTPTP